MNMSVPARLFISAGALALLKFFSMRPCLSKTASGISEADGLSSTCLLMVSSSFHLTVAFDRENSHYIPRK